MTVNLANYILSETLYEGINTVIYRARRRSDFLPVIIKTLKAEYPTIDEITRLRHEYKILKSLSEVKKIVKVHSLETTENGFALILEDFDGVSFRQILNSENLPILSFLPIAIQLSETIHEIHKHHIIHKDINLQNIVLDPQTWTVKLIDFSIASRLSKETPAISNADKLEGTLAYMSPEQTGRMNRLVDYRTDFYSLGVTFYEMLTGKLPFTTTDALELVHCHIAVNPVPPHQLFPEVPIEVSDIVMKLMAKNAEDRYQSALGLKADLETCLNQLQTHGEIINFTIGQLDKSSQLLISQKLYGRTDEVRSLLETCQRVSTGKSEMLLISGYSGIGKTSIVNEVHKLIAQQKIYFIAGKFDQLKKNIPYAALIQAFQELIQRLLTENSATIAIWKQRLLNALGQNAQLMINVIPEVQHIIGHQPPLPEIGAAELQNILHHLFQQFIDVVAAKDHPLVLFLDDLQWADSASLKLIESIMCNPDSKYLLLIGAYRDNEVSPTHPTMLTVERIIASKAIVNNIVLQSLNFANVSKLIANTLDLNTNTQANALEAQDVERFNPLTELIYNKTQGNPFFLTQLLQTLYDEQLLYYEFENRQWQWNIHAIQALSLTDYNVIELIAHNIQKLPDTTQQVLKLAACMGHQFTLDNLAIVHENSVKHTSDHLWAALQSGLILPLSQAYKIPQFIQESEELEPQSRQFENVQIAYKFLHDKVQQAAYSLIPDEQRKKTHLEIGQLLLQNLKDSESQETDLTAKLNLTAVEENIFDIVNQLNIGVDLISNVDEKEQLAHLNLIAGRKAKQATAYESAVRYLNVGLGLLQETAWETHYNLALNLHTEAVEAEYLNTNYDRAQQISNLVLEKAQNILEKVKVYEIKIQFYIAQNLMLQAIDTALEVLKMLGVSLPKNPNKFSILQGSLCTKLAISSKQIDELVKLKDMTDPHKLAAMRVLVAVLVPAFLTTPNLFPLVTFKIVNLSIKYGNSPQAAYGYALYGWLLCGALGDINSGYQFGKLAIKLIERFNAPELKCKVVNIFNAFVRHWKEHGKKTIPTFVEALQMSLETGDIEYAGYSSINVCHYSFLTGEDLETVSSAQKPYIDLLRKLKQEYAIHSVSTVRQTVLNLLGKSENPCRLIGDSFNEEEMLPVFQAANVSTSLFMAYFYKSMLLYLFQEPQAAVENAELAEQYAATSSGFMTLAVHNFYYSLALLAICHNQGNVSQRKQLLKKVELNQKIMKNWSVHCPENYQHKYELVEAEKARVMGQYAEAKEHYDRAIQGSREFGYIQEESLANELAADFYCAYEQQSLAELYLLKSYYGYIRWGAKAKVKNLESKYPQFFSRILQREHLNIDVTNTVTTVKSTIHSAALDVAATTKALEVISAERVFDKLVAQLMHITIQTAGASQGLLLLSKDDKLELLAVSGSELAHHQEQRELVATQSMGTTEVEVRMLSYLPIEEIDLHLPMAAINYVTRTQETVVLNNATVEGIFVTDPYIQKNQPQSLLCMPLIYEGKSLGILYLENNLTVGAFTKQRLEVLKLLTSQAAMSLVQN